MTSVDQTIKAAVAAISEKIFGRFTIGLVLGSGLGDFAETLPDPLIIPTSAIPSYPIGSVSGHKGRLVIAELAPGSRLLAFQGRVHFYETGDLDAVLFPIRLAAELGVKTLIITNAAGGVNRIFLPGDLMIIRDQINLTSESPQRSEAYSGGRAASLYDQYLVDLALGAARDLSLPIQCGVYAGVKGPSYETAAEVEMVHRAGGDAVGMSTVLEVCEARAHGMRILGISCITNRATGIGSQPLAHTEVTEVAARVTERFQRLLRRILEKLV